MPQRGVGSRQAMLDHLALHQVRGRHQLGRDTRVRRQHPIDQVPGQVGLSPDREVPERKKKRRKRAREQESRAARAGAPAGAPARLCWDQSTRSTTGGSPGGRIGIRYGAICGSRESWPFLPNGTQVAPGDSRQRMHLPSHPVTVQRDPGLHGGNLVREHDQALEPFSLVEGGHLGHTPVLADHRKDRLERDLCIRKPKREQGSEHRAGGRQDTARNRGPGRIEASAPRDLSRPSKSRRTTLVHRWSSVAKVRSLKGTARAQRTTADGGTAERRHLTSHR